MNEKRNNQIGHLIKIAIEVGILLFAIAVAWATLRGTVNNTVESVNKHEIRITAAEQQVSDVKADIREIKVEQKYISQGIAEIKKKLNE